MKESTARAVIVAIYGCYMVCLGACMWKMTKANT